MGSVVFERDFADGAIGLDDGEHAAGFLCHVPHGIVSFGFHHGDGVDGDVSGFGAVGGAADDFLEVAAGFAIGHEEDDLGCGFHGECHVEGGVPLGSGGEGSIADVREGGLDAAFIRGDPRGAARAAIGLPSIAAAGEGPAEVGVAVGDDGGALVRSHAD